MESPSQQPSFNAQPGKAIFSMRDLLFIGFFCGPIGLGVALWLSLRRVGERRLANFALRAGILLFLAETVVFSFVSLNAIYFHITCGVLAKVSFDRWLMRPAGKYVGSGGRYASNLHVFTFWILFQAVLIAGLFAMSSLFE